MEMKTGSSTGEFMMVLTSDYEHHEFYRGTMNPEGNYSEKFSDVTLEEKDKDLILIPSKAIGKFSGSMSYVYPTLDLNNALVINNYV